MTSLFCRHNRFTADCPICSRGTVLDSEASPRRSAGPGTRSSSGARSQRSRRSADGGGRAFKGPYVSVGPFERDDGTRYEVRLERVPGGVRLAEWSGGALERRAPSLAPSDLRELLESAREREVLSGRDAEALASAADGAAADGDGAAPARAAGAPPDDPHREFGASGGEAGLLKEELRVERLDGALRIARWLLRPGSGWELQDSPPMLPAARYADALADAARRGLLG